MKSAIFFDAETLEMFQTIMLEYDAAVIYLNPDKTTAVRYLKHGELIRLIIKNKLQFLGHI